MPFDYFNRLPRSKQRIYVESDRTSSIKLPESEKLYPLVQALEKALSAGDREGTERAAQQLTTTMTDSLKIRPLKIRVLDKRPSDDRGELQGLYQPEERDKADQITVWMRTAKRKQVVAFKTFLRTLLHEVCHHLDYEFLGLKETFHTQGFFKRESSLYHQMVPPKP